MPPRPIRRPATGRVRPSSAPDVGAFGRGLDMNTAPLARHSAPHSRLPGSPAPGGDSAAGPAWGAPAVDIRRDPASGQLDFCEGNNPVLRYNYQSVEPGELLDKVTPANRNNLYARACSDYIHPLFGPNTEVLTRDWPVDHPHHRAGIYRACPRWTLAPTAATCTPCRRCSPGLRAG